MKLSRKIIISLVLLPLLLYSAVPSFSQNKPVTSKLIYVPVYSSIYHGNQDRVINLAVTLSIRNVNSNKNITLNSVEYFDKSGNFIVSYLNTPVILKPYETLNYIVKESDTKGGSTSGFVIKWNPGNSINDLFVEAVMIGTYPQGISFTSQGVHLK